MLNFKGKIATATVTGTLFLSAISPAFAATDIHVSGNGSGSDNNVSVSQRHSSRVEQSNDADIRNDISISSSTGGNRASGNTGGGSSIETGDTSALVGISNMANMNQASLGDCGECDGDTEIRASGNGSGSDSDIEIDMDSDKRFSQDSRSRFDNRIEMWSNSGGNRGDDNTGRHSSNDSVEISTGESESEVFVSNSSNLNSLGNSNHMNNMEMEFQRMMMEWNR